MLSHYVQESKNLFTYLLRLSKRNMFLYLILSINKLDDRRPRHLETIKFNVIFLRHTVDKMTVNISLGRLTGSVSIHITQEPRLLFLFH